MSPAPSAPGGSVGHYNLLETLGRGGLGEVHRARDAKIGRTVALKVIEPGVVADPARRRALMDDARLAMALSHPNIAALFDAGAAGGVHYLAYEFAAGAPLRGEMNGRPMRPRRAADLCIQIADALADGHATGLVHGDLRPETVVVTSKGSVKLLDFGMSRWTRGGLVRRAAGRAPESLADDDAAIAAYMAPEQAVGGQTDGRADVFALGTLLHEMLTGRHPFAAASVIDTVMRIASTTPPPPSADNSDVPPELDAVLARALAKDLEQRYQSAAALSADLRRVAQSLEQRPPERDEAFLLQVDDAADRVPAAVWLAALTGVAALAAVIYWVTLLN